MNSASLNGIELAFEESGRGSQALLLIHGHPFDHTMWRPQFEPMTRLGWRLIVPDLRGYGVSRDGGGEKATLEVFARDLIALLDHLKVEQAVVAGLSMGGQIAMEICRVAPNRVKGLVLAATFPRAETTLGKQQRIATAERLMNEGMAAYAAEMLPKMLAARSIQSAPEMAEHVLRMMRNAPPGGAAAALRGRAERPDYSSILERFERPALIVVGDEDAFTTRQDADRMHTLLKDSQLLWLPGVGHMPNLEQPDAFNRALSGFLARFKERQIAFVTGATSGFGAAIARRFLEDGFQVIALGRRAERLSQLQNDYGSTRVHSLTVDITDRAAVPAAITGLPEEFQAVDCLVNNAGLALGMGGAQNASAADWDRMIDTNCRGLVHVTRALLPGMVARGRGLIINMGSVAGTYPYPGGNVYGATKAFVHQFSLNLRSDLHGTGVRVSCIEPGMCGGTEFSKIRFEGDLARAAKVYEGMQPLSAEDIADAVAWITSLPAHVNINTIELMPVAQSFAPFQVR
ncbi:MAG TPA: SDR family NAD(P)-dependent oxidoreductase [Steroidobacteraceae bacterium]|nr:SDR family NAD(P)-dependent oxidoreductase [Steroidobacteraceae bacterium]